MTTKQIKKQQHLYISTPIVQRYNATAAWVFAYVGYFICNGGFDTTKSWPSLVKKYTGIEINTYKKWLQRFVDDEILIKNESIYTFNNENMLFDDVFESYKLLFDNNYNEKINYKTLPLVELNPRSVDEENFQGKKAAHQRLVVTIEAIALNAAASKQEFDNESPTFELSSCSWLARELGCDYRTIKAVIETISKVRMTFDKIKETGTSISLHLRKIAVVKIKAQFKIYEAKIERYKKQKNKAVRRFSDKFKANKHAY